VAKLVDARDSKSRGGNIVSVRVRPPAPDIKNMNKDCIFCKIASKEIYSVFLDESDFSIVIKDLYPKSSIHELIIPKKHIVNILDLELVDKDLISDLFFLAKKRSAYYNNCDFKIVLNNGISAGQCIFHMHIHFLSGVQL
jgi:histidine triad (HIT) family protein